MENNNETKLNEKQAEKVNGGNHYSNTEIKDHVGETMIFTCFSDGTSANVKVLGVDFEEGFFANKCLVYVMPADRDSQKVMLEHCKKYPDIIKQMLYENFPSFRINYGALWGTYLEKIG